uniref:S-adenosylmethionine mitochondrial carrier protein n=1 Tax=Schistocephalus solidus TaxID=70667 RepID=A0A0V0J314_SCHSO
MSIGDLLTREQSTHLLAGATAGLCVEIGVYPLDTMKTRLQSVTGTIRASCGRLHLFAGLPAVLVASAPSGAAFFYAYEMGKRGSLRAGAPMWLSSMVGAGAGEITSLILRVPFENVKQRTQSRPHLSVYYVASEIVQVEGWRGLYRGFLSTMLRELPCSLIQFPVWEFTKKLFAVHNRSKLPCLCTSVDVSSDASILRTENLTKSQFAFCGFVAGAVAGAVTTPVDVAKTRIMLADKDSLLASGRILTALRVVYHESGVTGLFAGLAPRMGLMSIGGALFLGLYDITKSMWADFLL